MEDKLGKSLQCSVNNLAGEGVISIPIPRSTKCANPSKEEQMDTYIESNSEINPNNKQYFFVLSRHSKPSLNSMSNGISTPPMPNSNSKNSNPIIKGSKRQKIKWKFINPLRLNTLPDWGKSLKTSSISTSSWTTSPRATSPTSSKRKNYPPNNSGTSAYKSPKE